MTRLMSTPILFAAYTIFSVSGMVLVKYSTPLLKTAISKGHTVIYPGLLVSGGAVMYIIGFLLWMVILAREPLTVAYPIAVGLTMLFSTACALLLLHESITWSAAAGALLVLVGVTLLARS